ncbi:MAG: hypothetical protein PF508_20175 [Spirochaeta sp.]|nr:hypothetical protein [Spirochaeta sp.]
MDLNRVTRVDDHVSCRNALISVADKRGLADFVAELWRVIPDLTIFSSGGTFREISAVAERDSRAAQIREVSEYTGQPEMQGGLVKTLDFNIYLGLLSETYNPAHQDDLSRQDARTFDLTVCNFYPFEEAAATAGARVEDLRTSIDIGGPAMLRASAKNFLRVAAVCASNDYSAVLEELRTHDGATTLAFRSQLAAKAFQYTAHYENAIAGALGSYIRHTSWNDVYEIDPDAADSREVPG